MPSAQLAESRKVTVCMTLIDGPDPTEIILGAKLRFTALHRHSLFGLTVAITTVLEKPMGDLPTEGLAVLRDIMDGHENDGDIFFEGKLMVYSQSNANGTGAFVGVAHPDIRGLWRRSHHTIAELMPRGNGFIDFLE